MGIADAIVEGLVGLAFVVVMAYMVFGDEILEHFKSMRQLKIEKLREQRLLIEAQQRAKHDENVEDAL